MKLAALVHGGLLVTALASDCDSNRRLESTEAFVLDDVDATGIGWHRGTYKPCLDDAYGGMFHHDWANDKGKVNATYTFDPPKDGCYVLEEYHPGQNAQCAQYLPTNARVDVAYCKGKTTYTYLDQSQGGGQWNILGALPYFKGWQGKITVANQGTGNTCRLGSGCFWVADAFRLTWVSEIQRCTVPDWMHTSSNITEPPSSQQADAQLADPHSWTSTPKPAEAAVETTVVTERQSQSVLDPVQPLIIDQVVVDDVSIGTSSNWQRYESQRQRDRHVPLTCGVQGWQQSFLFLDPQESNDAETAVEFAFDPPVDGCYLLEEFHPENRCSKAFSSAAALTIHYCKGLRKLAEVDQTQKGNQWNTVALLPFYKGHAGKVQVSHPQVGSTIAVADAFRFTRVSATCHDAHVKAVHFQRLAQNAVSVIVDAHKRPDASDTCGKKALGGSLHAAATGGAGAQFDFQPSSTGCYRIDSFHPEEDEGCDLADNADIEINWCLGKRSTTPVGLKGHGNRWNTIGHFKYYAGNEGSVVSRRASDTPDGKYWVADAMRFTKVADSCFAIPHAGLISLHISGPSLDGLDSSVLDAGLTSYPDMRLALHEALAEAAELPRESVRVLSLRKGSIIVDAEVIGTEVEVAAAISRIEKQIKCKKSNLAKGMCEAVISDHAEDTSCTVTVMHSNVLPSREGTDEESWPLVNMRQNSPDTISSIVAISVSSIIVGLFVFSCVVVKGRMLEKRSIRRVWADPVSEFTSNVGKDCDTDASKVDPFDAKKPYDDEISLAGSTATPNSAPSVTDLEVMSVASGQLVSAVPTSPRSENPV
jgi:hypothetical protein